MNSDAGNIKRFLSVYKKSADEPCGEIPLENMDLTAIRHVLNLSNDDPLVYVYAVNDKLRDVLLPYSNEPIDLNAFDYFLECESTKST